MARRAWFALGMSLVLVAAFLAALAGVAGAAKVNLVHWQHFHEGRAAALQSLLKSFNEQNPDIQVTLDFPPYEQYFDKLLAALATGTGPDVFQVPMEMAEQLVNSGLITPVPASVATTAQIESQYLDWTVARFKKDGQYYGLPTDVQHLVLFINDELARQSGLDPKAPPRTWDELLEQARKATRRDAQGNITQAGLDTRYRWAVYMSLLTQYMEGDMVDPAAKRALYDNADGLAAWRFAEQIVRGPQAVDSPRFMTGQRKFENNRAVFYINHPVARSVIGQMAPNLGYTVAPVPAVTGKPVAATGHHWAYVVSTRSANKEAAWRWVQFLASEEAQRVWMTAAGDLPSLIRLASDPSLIRNANERVIMESLKLVKPDDTVGQASVTVRNDLWDSIALTDTPVETLVRQAVQRENAIIQQTLR